MIQFIYEPHLSAVFNSCRKCCRQSKAVEFDTSLVSCYFPFCILVWKVVGSQAGLRLLIYLEEIVISAKSENNRSDNRNELVM